LRLTGRVRQSALNALGSRTSARLGWTWTVLVVAQVALSTAVLPRTGEFMWTQLQPNFLGREFAAEQYLTAKIMNGADESRGTRAELVRRVKANLDVSDATVSAAIDGIDEAIRSIELDTGSGESFAVASNQVDETYFDVFNAALLTGRPFEPAD